MGGSFRVIGRRAVESKFIDLGFRGLSRKEMDPRRTVFFPMTFVYLAEQKIQLLLEVPEFKTNSVLESFGFGFHFRAVFTVTFQGSIVRGV